MNRYNDEEESDEEVGVMGQKELMNDVRRLYPGLTDIMGNRTGAEFSGHGEGRSSKNSQRSGGGGGVNGSRRRVSSRNGVGTSQRKKRRSTKTRATSSARNQTTTTTKALMDTDHNRMMTATGLSSDSFTSNSSSFALPIVAINGTQSSSGMSLGKQSRSSKTSCDVATQANAYEIATQTRSYGDSNDGLLSAIVACKQQSSTTRAIMAKGQRRDESCDNSDDDADSGDRYVESHRLLGAASMVSAPVPSSTSAASMAMLMMGSATKRREVISHGRRSEVKLSESEKLRMLLLPSK